MSDDRDDEGGEGRGPAEGPGSEDGRPAADERRAGRGRSPADEPSAASGRDEDDLEDLALRARGEKTGWLSTYGQPLWRILLLLAMLVGIILFRKPCAEGMAGFVGNFGPPQPARVDGGATRTPASRPAPSVLDAGSGPR